MAGRGYAEFDLFVTWCGAWMGYARKRISLLVRRCDYSRMAVPLY